MKRIISALLCVLMVFTLIPNMEIDANAAFVVRTSKPADTNMYYIQTAFGGNNECILGNGAKNGYVLPNNVGYVWGRVYEISDSKPNLSTDTADTWYSYNETNNYYGYGTQAKAGAVACWKNHVAFVESVNEDGTINVSQSHYEKKIEFEYYENMNPKEYLTGFQGYIYPLETFDTMMYYEPEHPHRYVYRNADKDLFFVNPKETCTNSHCSSCPGLSEKGYKIDNFSFPRVIQQGTDITVGGNLSSTQNIKWVIGVIRDADKNELQRNNGKYPGTKTYNLANINDQLDFSALPIGSYYFMLIIQSQNIGQMNNIYVPFEVKSPNYLWSVKNVVSPEGKLIKGEDFEISGNLFCVNNITWANASILDSTGSEILQTSSKEPQKTEFSVSELNDGLDFSVLEPGTYIYQLKAGTGGKGDMSNVERTFTILDNYEVSYDANGGSGAPDPQTKIQGEDLGIPSTIPTWENHEFLGWSTDKEATTREYKPSTVFSADKATKLYAVWKHPFEQISCVEPTCTTSGEKSYLCACGEAYTVNLAEKGHLCPQEWTLSKASTCTESGKMIKDCMVCGVNVFTKDILPSGHSWGEKKLVVEPTCTTEGKKASYCLICGETGNEDIISPVGHSYGEWVIDRLATYTISGERHKTCSACGDTVTETLPAEIEEYISDWILVEEAPAYAKIVDEKWTYDLQTGIQIDDDNYLLNDTSYVWSEYGEWSSWSEFPVNSSDYRQVEMKSATYKTQYKYSRYTSSSSTTSSAPWRTSAYPVYSETGWLDYKLTSTGTKSALNPNTGKYETYTVYRRSSASDLWYNETTRTTIDTKQQYRYRDRTKIYTYYYSVTSPTEITPEDATNTDIISNVQKYVRYQTHHKINFSFSGASCDESSRIVESGTAIGKLPEATKPGYIFRGWTCTNGGTDFVTAEDIVTSDLTLYASWELIVLERVEVSALPLKTGYCIGDVLETRGLKLRVTYNDESTKTVSSGFETAYDFSEPGEATVGVTYTERNVSVATSYEVYVNEPARIYSENVTVNAGETVDVPVYIENNPGMAGFTIYMEYDDTVFTPVCVNGDEISGYGMLDDNIGYTDENKVQVSWSGTENYYEDGELFNITFEVSGDSDVRGDYDFYITYNQADTFDEYTNDIVLECENNFVTVINEQKIPTEIGGNKVDVLSGRVVEIPVEVKNNSVTGGTDFTLTFDSSVLTFVGVVDGIATTSAESTGDGEVTVNVKNVTQTSAGTMFTVKFNVKKYYSGTLKMGITSTDSEIITKNVTLNITNPEGDMPTVVYSDPITGELGDIVLVPIYIENNDGLYGFKIRVTYDSNLLSPVSYSKAESILADCGTVNNNITKFTRQGKNHYDIMFYGDELFKENGKIFTLKFTLKDAIPGYTSVKLSYSQADTFTEVGGVVEDVELDCRSIGIKTTGCFVNSNKVYLSDLQNSSTIDLLEWLPVATSASIKNMVTKNGDGYGTGSTFDYIADGIRTAYTIIVKGDTDGDSAIDVLDAMHVERASNNQEAFTDAQTDAGDLNGDGEITAEDYSAMVNLALH